MLAAGDFAEFKVILDYIANQEVVLGQRTLAYWNHSGMWTTETTHLSGLYDNTDYGCSRVEGQWPDWLMQSGYLHTDQGGDSGTGEYPLMALDYLMYTNDPQAFAPYLKIAVQVANYFMYHFKRSADGSKVVIFPAQVLETYWWCVARSGSPQPMPGGCCSREGALGEGAQLAAHPTLSHTHTLHTHAPTHLYHQRLGRRDAELYQLLRGRLPHHLWHDHAV
jgi:hypothetical protein